MLLRHAVEFPYMYRCDSGVLGNLGCTGVDQFNTVTGLQLLGNALPGLNVLNWQLRPRMG